MGARTITGACDNADIAVNLATLQRFRCSPASATYATAEALSQLAIIAIELDETGRTNSFPGEVDSNFCVYECLPRKFVDG